MNTDKLQTQRQKYQLRLQKKIREQEVLRQKSAISAAQAKIECLRINLIDEKITQSKTTSTPPNQLYQQQARIKELEAEILWAKQELHDIQQDAKQNPPTLLDDTSTVLNVFIDFCDRYLYQPPKKEDSADLPETVEVKVDAETVEEKEDSADLPETVEVKVDAETVEEKEDSADLSETVEVEVDAETVEVEEKEEVKKAPYQHGNDCNHCEYWKTNSSKKKGKLIYDKTGQKSQGKCIAKEPCDPSVVIIREGSGTWGALKTDMKESVSPIAQESVTDDDHLEPVIVHPTEKPEVWLSFNPLATVVYEYINAEQQEPLESVLHNTIRAALASEYPDDKNDIGDALLAIELNSQLFSGVLLKNGTDNHQVWAIVIELEDNQLKKTSYRHDTLKTEDGAAKRVEQWLKAAEPKVREIDLNKIALTLTQPIGELEGPVAYRAKYFTKSKLTDEEIKGWYLFETTKKQRVAYLGNNSANALKQLEILKDEQDRILAEIQTDILEV